MTDWLVLLLGALVAGAVVAWLVARAHYRAAALGEGQVLRDRLAASQAMVDELRRQVGRLEQESHATARSVGAEREGRARAEAGLEAARQSLDEQRALLDLAERSQSLTQERFEELAELPRPLVGNLDGERAAARLLGMANHIAGRQ